MERPSIPSKRYLLDWNAESSWDLQEKMLINRVLICGAGQLGARYLQGLAACRMPLEIFVQDSNPLSLQRAEKRWQDADGEDTFHKVLFSTSPDFLPNRIDLSIVATTADSRPLAVTNISQGRSVRHWVLEKVLAQSEAGLDEIAARIPNDMNAWVNTPRRSMPWHRAIGEQLGLRAPMTFKYAGGAWGLACNAIHFLDLVAFWTGESLVDVSTAHLTPEWHEGKRVGNWEVYGTLEGRYSNGSQVVLTATVGGAPHMEMFDERASWVIDEKMGLALRSDGLAVQGRISQQSELTAGLCEAILKNGTCDLPTLRESSALHRVFLRRMQDHWKQAGHPFAVCVPIT